jgi:hypothetical protein
MTWYPYQYARLVLEIFDFKIRQHRLCKIVIKGVSITTANHEQIDDENIVRQELTPFGQTFIPDKLIKLDVQCTKATVSIKDNLLAYLAFEHPQVCS